MAKYTNDTGRKLIYTDPVTETTRQIPGYAVFWAQGPNVENLTTDTNIITVTDLCDQYGKYTRREFVTGVDIGADYVAGSEGNMKVLDEFVGVGESQDLTGLRFKRTRFLYRDSANADQWSHIFESHLLDGDC